MRHLGIAVVLASTVFVASCGKKSSGQRVTSTYKSSPEDLPYTGETPLIKTVSFVLNLFGEEGGRDKGTGSLQPFFSSDSDDHVEMDEQPFVAIEWTVEGQRMTMVLATEPKSTCIGELSDGGEKLEVEVADCPPLARNVSAATVTFAPSSGPLRPRGK